MKRKAFISYLFILISIILISCGTRFDKGKWKHNISERHEMVSDLTSNILPGLSKNEIIAILGKSDSLYFIGSDLVYNLGIENSIISIDNDWLLIYVDKQGIYDKFEIKSD